MTGNGNWLLRLPRADGDVVGVLAVRSRAPRARPLRSFRSCPTATRSRPPILSEGRRCCADPSSSAGTSAPLTVVRISGQLSRDSQVGALIVVREGTSSRADLYGLAPRFVTVSPVTIGSSLAVSRSTTFRSAASVVRRIEAPQCPCGSRCLLDAHLAASRFAESYSVFMSSKEHVVERRRRTSRRSDAR